MQNPWECMSISYRVNQARIVAVLAKDGGAIVEGPIDLAFDEGRYHSYEGQGEGQPLISTLDYHCAWEVVDAPAPDHCENVGARIVNLAPAEVYNRLHLRRAHRIAIGK